MDVNADCDNANGNNVDPKDKDARSLLSALRVSFDRIREFVLSHAFLFCNDDGEVDGGGTT